MTKSELFKRAHKIARLTKEAAGSYQIAFSVALRALYAGKFCDFGSMLNSLKGILECAGANWHLCRDYRSYVVYMNNAAAKLGYDHADDLAGASLKIGNAPSKEWCRFVVWAYANKASLALKAYSFRRASASFDVEDILSLGGGEEVYARMTR